MCADRDRLIFEIRQSDVRDYAARALTEDEWHVVEDTICAGLEGWPELVRAALGEAGVPLAEMG